MLIRRASAILALGGIVAGIECVVLSAQTDRSPAIRIESREVVLPIVVVRVRRSVGTVIGSDGELRPGWVLDSKEVTGLSAKSVRVFDDAREMAIQHFSVEKLPGWEVQDNVGRHLAYSCTPGGIWVGPDIESGLVFIDDSRFHPYVVTYIPPPSPTGSCHRITIQVDRKHTTVFAPSQYCNTEDPLSDPLRDTDLGNKVLSDANSNQFGGLPLSVAVSTFTSPSGAGRVNVVADLPADLLKRHWDGIHLVTSIAVLGLVFDAKGTLVSRFSDTACAPEEDSHGFEGPILLPADVKEGAENAVIPGGYMTQVGLNPGDYRLEFLLTDGEKFGRADASFTVAEFSSSALSMSDIALCKRYHKPLPDERGPTRAPQYVPLMFDGQEFTPTGDTRFDKAEELMAYVEIYGSQVQSSPAARRYLEMKVFDEKTNELKVGTGLRPVGSQVRTDYRAIPVVWQMRLAKLPPGAYRLEVQASDSAGNKSLWRAARFSVEEANSHMSAGVSAGPRTKLADVVAAIGKEEEQAPQEPRGVSPQGAYEQERSASDLLKKISETYRQVSSFSVVAEKKVAMDTDRGRAREGVGDPNPYATYVGHHRSEDIRVTLMTSTSAKAKLLLKDQKQEVAVVSDGERVWTSIPAQYAYTVAAVRSADTRTPVYLPAIGGNDISGVDLLQKYTALFAARFRELSKHGSWAKLEHPQTLNVGKDKKECYVLTIEMPGGAQKERLWVDKTAFTIWKSVETTLWPWDYWGVQLQTTTTLITEQMALNPSMDDRNFVFTPPDNARKVDFLMLSGKNPF